MLQDFKLYNWEFDDDLRDCSVQFVSGVCGIGFSVRFAVFKKSKF